MNPHAQSLFEQPDGYARVVERIAFHQAQRLALQETFDRVTDELTRFHLAGLMVEELNHERHWFGVLKRRQVEDANLADIPPVLPAWALAVSRTAANDAAALAALLPGADLSASVAAAARADIAG